ncbi:DUF1622 domain-containing protein [Niameybacter massiliensis]|uniref:DUF1622 domain-containing protein n=1 Tax=Niameybacter massiliensis TaxID=1658108 RepID=UPI0006B50774|nr:DUF1622 domain-containing protein [Niameybacter massiliensis]
MLEFLITRYLPALIHVLEAMGIIVLTIGAANGFYHYMVSLFHHNPSTSRSHFASSMAISLEFKLAAEILKTVLVRTIDEIIILGAIILLRALMTLIIHWEIRQDSPHERTDPEK